MSVSSTATATRRGKNRDSSAAAAADQDGRRPFKEGGNLLLYSMHVNCTKSCRMVLGALERADPPWEEELGRVCSSQNPQAPGGDGEEATASRDVATCRFCRFFSLSNDDLTKCPNVKQYFCAGLLFTWRRGRRKTRSWRSSSSTWRNCSR